MMFEYFKRCKKYKQTVRELQMMSDRELYDIGISRHDIRRVAREASNG